MPGATSSTFENDLSGLPSRFAGMATSSSSASSSSRLATRGKSCAPTSSSSSSGYSSSFGGKSYGSSSSSSSGSYKIVHSFPLSVSSKVSRTYIECGFQTIDKYFEYPDTFEGKYRYLWYRYFLAQCLNWHQYSLAEHLYRYLDTF